MPDQDLFNQDTNSDGVTTPSSEDGTPSASSSDALFADQLKEIVNEQGKPKYDSLPKAIEGLKHAQDYIPQLKGELEKRDEEIAKLREAVAKSEAVEDVVSRLSSQGADETKSDALSKDQVAAMFEQLITGKEKQAQAVSNINTVQSSLLEKFGTQEAAQAAIAAKAKELDTTPEALGDLAKTNPKMVLTMFPGSKVESTGSPVGSSVITEGLQPKPSEGLQRPEKSLLAGATTRDQVAFLKQIREDVYKKFNITE